MARVTVVDVATYAGVSKSTVSLVLNNSDRVHAATAQRVQEAIRELNYVPSRAARALQSGRSEQLGVVVSDITNPYFAELVRSVTVAAGAQNLDILTLDTDYDPMLLRKHLERLFQYRCEGILVFTTESDATIPELILRSQVPAVVLNWGDCALELSQLLVDYRPGIDALLADLVKLGHRRFGFAFGPESYYSANLKRIAFDDACRALGDRIEPSHYLAGEARLSLSVGHHLVDKILSIREEIRPTALIVNNDVMALSLMRALYERGIAVPQEISVAGIDDIDAAAYMMPALTTLRQPRRRMGQLAVEMLLRQLQGERAHGEKQTIQVRLISRESTGPVPESAPAA